MSNDVFDWAYIDTRTGKNFEVIARPFIRYADNGKAVYGDPFKIVALMMDKREVLTTQDGVEISVTRKYMTPDNRIKEHDLVGNRRVLGVDMINSLPIGNTHINYWIYT